MRKNLHTILNTCCLFYKDIYFWYFKIHWTTIKKTLQDSDCQLVFLFLKVFEPYTLHGPVVYETFMIHFFLSYIVLFEKKITCYCYWLFLIMTIKCLSNSIKSFLLFHFQHLTHIWTEVTIDVSLYKATMLMDIT